MLCAQTKYLLGYLGKIRFIRKSKTTESLKLSQKYLSFGILRQKSRDVLVHIALAVILIVITL
jgi:hypothetical protein